MPNDCYSVLIVRRTLGPENTGIVGHPRLVSSNNKARCLPHHIRQRGKDIADFGESLEAVNYEPDALRGPTVPFPLGYLETERVGAFVFDSEIRSVHRLESDWVPPVREFRDAVHRFPKLIFELVYIEPNEETCGARIGMNGEVIGSYDADFCALEAAKDLLTADELAEKPSYLSNHRWFLLIQAYRLAGLRKGEVVSLQPLTRDNESAAESPETDIDPFCGPWRR
jgi:hypothetical protein